MLIYLFLSVILSVSFLNAEENKTFFCIVDCDSPGFIILEPAIGKDSTQVDSRSIFLDNSTVTFNTTLPDKWTLISSLNNNDNKFHEHVSDQRWETLPNSHSEIAKIMRALENATVSVFLSVRLNKNETSVINGSKIGWNLLMKNGSETYLCDNHQTSCTESHLRLEKSVSELFNNLFSALWKLHDYTYFYTEKITNTEIYTKRESCSYVRKGCLVMYLAMCKNCNVTVLLNTNTVAYSVNGRNNSIMGTGTWMTVEIDLGNFTDCFSLAAETIARNGSEDVFWAIGDTIYISTTLSCHENKRYISLDTTKKLTDFFCETVTNKPLNFSTQLLKPLNKTEKFPLTTTKNDTVPTNKASSFSVVYIIIIALLITIIITTVVAVLCKRRFWARTPTEASVAFESVRLLDVASNSETIDRKDWPLPIKRGEFEDYIHKNCDLRESSTELQLQFSALPSGYLKECNEGKKEANLAKNRYPKILPYDDTRVKLKANLGDTGTSDYINASYIKGFNSDKEYIVTQNPLENTAVDFWRMISQEQVEHIVMISNKEEGVHQYWPQFNKTESYGGIEVSFTEHDMYEFYDHRVFTITCFGENRVINQFHFHAWSKEMLAAYVFADFINRLLMIPHQSAPVVFHCKAGVGRSATILLCDIALRSVAITGNFDLFSITKTMRECRVDMVQNIRQYVLAHLIIYEALNYKDLAIGLDEDCENNFSKYFEGNLVKRLWSSYLENREWIDEVIMPYHICANYPKLNRYVDPNLLPVEHSRVKLDGLEEADYIHAMYVNDYNQMKNFIVAQQPMRATMTNFWLMVLEKSVTTIINLHELDPRCGDLCYYPVWNQKFLEINDDILIKLDSEEQHRNYEKLTIIFTRNEQQRKIKLFCIKNWSKIKALPDSTDVVVSLWEAMGDQNPDYPTLICCDDGIRASSFVACFFYMADKMIHERKCDVVGAVRAVRRTHHNFINFEQFVFLFHCAVAFYKNCVE